MVSLKYIVSRVIQTFFLLWLVLTGIFLLFRLMPGDFADMMLFQGASPESVAAFEERWGLNQPLYVQYYNYIINFIMLDVGESLAFRVPVWEYVKMRLFNSIILIAPAITFAYILGSAIGVLMGIKRGTKFEEYGLVPIIIAGSFPSFFIAIMLVIVFSAWLGWFPTSGMFPPGGPSGLEDPTWWEPYFTWEFGHHYILPFTAIVLRYLFLPTLLMRTSIVEVSGQDFAFFHRMTGIPYLRQLRHLTKHASLPVITLYPVSMTRAIGGLVLIEMVFNWPGIGYELIQAVIRRDFPVVQFIFFLAAAFIIISNFVVDIIYGFIDPRIDIEE